jgi:NitT/TauT family transport system substrate-binding protein
MKNKQCLGKEIKMPTMTWRSLLLAGAMLTALGVTPGAAADKVKVKVISDWAFQAQAAVFTNAIDKGYFAAENLDVTIDRGYGSADAITKLASGAYDIAFGDINSMMDFNAKNPDKTQAIAVMMIFDRPPLSIFTFDKSIKTPKDLEGKKMVTSPGEANLRMFPLFAKLAKFDRTKVELVNVQPQLREQMLLKGAGNVATGFYYVSIMNFKALGADTKDLKSFMYSDYGIKVYGNAIITSKAYAASKPEVVKAFNRAVAKSMHDTIKTPAATIPSIKKRDGTIDEAIEVERLNIINKLFVLTPYVQQHGFGGIDKQRMSAGIDQVTEALELPTKPKVDDVFTDKFLPPAKDRMLN